MGELITARKPAALVAAAAFVLYAGYALRRHQLFETSAYDLGIFGQGVQSYAHGRLPTSDIRADPGQFHGAGYPLLGDHFHPVIALLAPLYRLFPHIEVLLVVQAALVAGSVYVLTRCAARTLGDRGPWVPPALGTAYALSWGIQRMVGFDFHEVAFALPLLCLAMEAYLSGRWVACAAWASGLLLVKEDMGFTVGVFGFLLLLKNRDRRLGIILCVVGPTVAALAILVIVPHFNPAHVYGYLGGEAADGSGIGGFLKQPWRLPVLLVWPPRKLVTVVLVLLPVAFLALRSPLILLAVPTLAVRFIADNAFYWGTKYHYSAVLMPIVFFALVDVVRRGERTGGRSVSALTGWPAPGLPVRLEPGLAVLALALSPLFGLGEVATPRFWHGDAQATAADRMVRLIPSGARVAASDDTAPHLVDRDTVYLARGGAIITGVAPPVDWILANLRTKDSPTDPQLVTQAVADGFVEVAEDHGYVLLRRR